MAPATSCGSRGTTGNTPDVATCSCERRHTFAVKFTAECFRSSHDRGGSFRVASRVRQTRHGRRGSVDAQDGGGSGGTRYGRGRAHRLGADDRTVLVRGFLRQSAARSDQLTGVDAGFVPAGRRRPFGPLPTDRYAAAAGGFGGGKAAQGVHAGRARATLTGRTHLSNLQSVSRRFAAGGRRSGVRRRCFQAL
jgi:hypothetical protein